MSETIYICDECGRETTYEGHKLGDKYICDECYIEYFLRSL